MSNGMHEYESSGGLPRQTTPTWEVELLISGVAVFAMLQLPGLLDDRVLAFAPRLDATWGGLLLILYIYAKSAALILGVTFVLHLLLRARWIALVGMHSVYPDGIDWERLRMGPVQRKVEAALDRGSEAAIESADNGATMVFSIGVMLATMIAIIACVLAAGISALTLASRELGLRLDAYMGLLALLALVMLPFSAALFIDRAWGKRLPPGGRMERSLVATLRFYSRLGLGRGRNRVHSLLGSHHGDFMISAITVLIMFGALLATIGWYGASKDPARIGNYALFPSPAAGASIVDSSHYDDQRDPVHDPATPYIQGMVVAGPYLRLVVPFQPRRDEPALQRACPATIGIHAASAAALSCLQQLHAASLDGKVLPDSTYVIGSDPFTDRPALVAMIDVRGLAPGRHELQVAQPPRTGNHDERDAEPAGTDDTVVRIPFWR